MRKQEKAGGAKTKDGSLEKHRKHLPASSLPQSRAAQHQEGSRRGILPCREKERRRPPQSHHSRGLQPVLSRIPQSSSKLNSTDSHPESPLLTHLLKDGAASAIRPAATPMPALHDQDATAPCHTGDWSCHGSAPMLGS